MVKDVDAYGYMTDSLDDYVWNADKGAYIKYDETDYFAGVSQFSNSPATFTRTSSASHKNVFTVRPLFNYSGSSYSSSNTQYTLTIDNTDHDIQSVTVRETYAPSGGTVKEQTVAVADKETIVLTLKNQMSITFDTDSIKFEKTVEYRECATNAYVETTYLNTFSRFDVGRQETVLEYKNLRDALAARYRVRGSIVLDWTIDTSVI
jgi:hypothetical protein